MADALGGNGRRTPPVTARQAATLATYADQMRLVFEATEAGDLVEAARVLNRLLGATGARPQLDPLATGGYHVHFHGSTDGLATGWGAGCATGLALAIGTDLAGRLGVCSAERCDRVYVDTSKTRGAGSARPRARTAPRPRPTGTARSLGDDQAHPARRARESPPSPAQSPRTRGRRATRPARGRR